MNDLPHNGRIYLRHYVHGDHLLLCSWKRELLYEFDGMFPKGVCSSEDIILLIFDRIVVFLLEIGSFVICIPSKIDDCVLSGAGSDARWLLSLSNSNITVDILA